MGHTRLGDIPKTRKWRSVVETMVGENRSHAPLATTVPVIANAALDAAEAGLDKAQKEAALKAAFYLLTQITLSARSEDWRGYLRRLGIGLSEDASAVDLLAGAQKLLDENIERKRARSDVAEMVQQAFGEAVADEVSRRAVSLFGAGSEELHAALRELSTKKGFSQLAQKFFGSFMYRYLNFYLSRVTAGQLDTTQLQQLGDLSEFNRALHVHCEQSAAIIRDFSGDWYSKTEYEEGIDESNVSRFTAVALKKLRAELKTQKETG
jgi:hypothetical protein